MIIFFIHRRDFLYFNVRKLFIFFSKRFVQGVGVARLIASKKKVRPHSSSWQGCVPWLPWRAGCVSHELMIGSPRLWSIPRKFNIAPKIGNPKRKLIFQPSFFRGELLDFGGVSDSLTETWSMTYIAGGFLQMSLFKKNTPSLLGFHDPMWLLENMCFS